MNTLSTMAIDDILKELTFNQKDDIYRKLRSDYVREDVVSLIEEHYELNPSTVQETIDTVVHSYVYDGKYDCNIPYWDNLHNLIEANLNIETTEFEVGKTYITSDWFTGATMKYQYEGNGIFTVDDFSDGVSCNRTETHAIFSNEKGEYILLNEYMGHKHILTSYEI